MLYCSLLASGVKNQIVYACKCRGLCLLVINSTQHLQTLNCVPQGKVILIKVQCINQQLNTQHIIAFSSYCVIKYVCIILKHLWLWLIIFMEHITETAVIDLSPISVECEEQFCILAVWIPFMAEIL